MGPICSGMINTTVHHFFAKFSYRQGCLHFVRLFLKIISNRINYCRKQSLSLNLYCRPSLPKATSRIDKVSCHLKALYHTSMMPTQPLKMNIIICSYPLLVGPSFTSTKYYIPNPPSPTPPGPPINYNMKVKLPAGLVCNKQCIFQVCIFYISLPILIPQAKPTRLTETKHASIHN